MKIYGIEEKMYMFKLEDDDWDFFNVTAGSTKDDCLYNVGLDKLDHEKVNEVLGSDFDESFDEKDESDQGWDILDYLYLIFAKENPDRIYSVGDEFRFLQTSAHKETFFSYCI